MWCLYVAENMTKCPLTRGVRLLEVCVSGGSTVVILLTSWRDLVVCGVGLQSVGASFLSVSGYSLDLLCSFAIFISHVVLPLSLNVFSNTQETLM